MRIEEKSNFCVLRKGPSTRALCHRIHNCLTMRTMVYSRVALQESRAIRIIALQEYECAAQPVLQPLTIRLIAL